ncbi:hypothetical protein B0A48_03325 [Cryoendolithus antarcticus]|uniref:C2H2-type domain-containing protein n=1 Tax=Cryoendolithus antarcticus TaxID=1507870 RepID=A0A1V8TK34_9PEZI|nr:hypothetical protein B0A48_03325 [Cryoendolithus antarcticus]
MHVCNWDGCGKTFQRSDHLQRHTLNHTTGDNRHLARHRQKDEEAGGEGLGVVSTRKRLWRDAEGNLVTKRPKSTSDVVPTEHHVPQAVMIVPNDQPLQNFKSPISPPPSLTSNVVCAQDDDFAFDSSSFDFQQVFNDPQNSDSFSEDFDFFSDVPWNIPVAPAPSVVPRGNVLMDDMFSSDTASSFNMPFTTMSNYNWLFANGNLAHGLADTTGSSQFSSDRNLGGNYGIGSTTSRDTSQTDDVITNLDASHAHVEPGTSAQVSPTSGQYIEERHARPSTRVQSVPGPRLDRMSFENLSAFSAPDNGHTMHSFSTNSVQGVPGVNERARTRVLDILQSPAFTATPQLSMLQVILLTECFGKSRAGQKQHDMSHLFHGMLINLIRRSDCQSAGAFPHTSEILVSLEDRWREAMHMEQRKRLALLCFLWDVQHALLFSQSLCMSAFELRTSLPCDPSAWEAETAAEWATYGGTPEPRFLATLKTFMNPDASATTPELNALSRQLILHGLMSIAWDLKRRDQTSLGSSGPTSDWQMRLGASYDMWRVDFDAYCMDMTKQLRNSPAAKEDFIRFSTSTRAIYHAAQLILHVELLDLQIYAGAKHILGRPVAPHDYQRSRKLIKRWVSDDGPKAAVAASHAAHLLRDGLTHLEDWDTDQTFHYPWCLYLATLTCWAFHRAPNDEDGGTASAEISAPEKRHDRSMNALVSSMTSAGPEGLSRLTGKLDTRGLVHVIAAHLGGVRWAVVHEGMKVLKSLS